MNYQLIHNQIIERAKDRTLTTYKEKHHIIPRCFGGTNDKENLVYLTAREHFIIHKLLVKIYPDIIGLRYAVWMMANKVDNDQYDRSKAYQVGAREYNRLREQFSKDHRETMSGCNNPFYNRTHTKETKQKISQTKKKQNLSGIKSHSYGKKHTKESKDKMSEHGKLMTGELNGFYNKKHTKESKDKMSKSRTGKYIGGKSYWYNKERSLKTREKCSIANKGKIWSEERRKTSIGGKRCHNPETKQNTVAKPDKLKELLNNGWLLGFYKTKQK